MESLRETVALIREKKLFKEITRPCPNCKTKNSVIEIKCQNPKCDTTLGSTVTVASPNVIKMGMLNRNNTGTQKPFIIPRKKKV
jgi:hypothetical protein